MRQQGVCDGGVHRQILTLLLLLWSTVVSVVQMPPQGRHMGPASVAEVLAADVFARRWGGGRWRCTERAAVATDS